MRVGSLVQIKGQIGHPGVVFQIEQGGDVHVRWPNGQITKHGGDENEPFPYWELEDVTPCLFVNIYLYDRAYGGSEEGGWWYDTYTPEDEQCRQFATEEEAEAYFEIAKQWCAEENEGRRPVSSVLSEGVYVACLESWPAEPQPLYPPHYC